MSSRTRQVRIRSACSTLAIQGHIHTSGRSNQAPGAGRSAMADGDEVTVKYAIDFIRGEIHEASNVDRRTPVELPIGSRLRDDVRATIQLQSDGSYSAALSLTNGMPLGLLIAAWPSQLDDSGVAFLLNQWLLILRSGDKSRYEMQFVKRGNLTYINLMTEYNGFSYLSFIYSRKGTFWDAPRLTA